MRSRAARASCSPPTTSSPMGSTRLCSHSSPRRWAHEATFAETRALGRAVSGRRRDPLPLGEPGGLPYSKGLMSRALVAAGVSIEPAYLLAKQLEVDLAARDATSVSFDHLEERAAELLGEDEGPQILLRLRRFANLQSLEMPIVLLVGGATGTGKSTVATEVAHVLGITRVTSTDFIRQTIRAFFS